MQSLIRSKSAGSQAEGAQRGPVLVGTFFKRLQMIRGQIRVIRHTHKCIATFFACASLTCPLALSLQR